ncbi:MAG: ArsA family ATPase [Acidimicrobiales bacterium]|nr:ArsA family ATPase [Acidimicrobiales bacterium]
MADATVQSRVDDTVDHTPPTVDAVVLLGAGGVGKTSTSAALGIAAARRGRRVVVLTVDPARRLVETLGLSSTYPSEVVEITGIGGFRTGTLHATMLDPGHTLTGLVDEFAPSHARATAIHRNRLFQSLVGSLSGLSEYMAAERFRQLIRDPRFDLVIVDTPPAQNGVDVLDAPNRLTDLLDHRLYRTLLAPRRGVLRTLNAATHLAARAIGRVVGATLLSDVIEFFALFEGMDRGFADRAAEVDALLTSARTHFLLVSTARPEPLQTATWISDQLGDRTINPEAMVINRRLTEVPPPTTSMPEPIRRALNEHNAVAESESEVLRSMSVSRGHRLVTIPDAQHEDPLGVLVEMSEHL